MKFVLLLSATLAIGCSPSALRTVETLNDAREALCDLLGDEQRAALEAEAQRVGKPFDEVARLWRESCRFRLLAAERESVGAIGGDVAAQP